MLKKRLIISLTFLNGVLFRTKKFLPDYRYTKNFIDLFSIDEIIIIDISKKKFSKSFFKIIEHFSTNCYVPICIGGGIKNLNDADKYFKIGADKVLLGPTFIQNSEKIKKISEKYGSQSIVQSIDLRKKSNQYKICSKSGQIFEKINPIEAIKNSIENGAGEILLNNIDLDGSLLGFDIQLIKTLKQGVKLPILALGGGGNWKQISDLFLETDISGVCTQNIFHFTEQSINSAKKFMRDNNISIRL